MAAAPRSLRGSVVAITGGARGIGRATAEALLREGAKVAIGDLDGAAAEQTATELGQGTLGLALDVTDRAAFAAFLDRTERDFGPLDVLVNNAGIMLLSTFADESDEAAAAQIAVNLLGVINGTKEALGRMGPRDRGHIVNVASMAGKIGAAGGATYAATKHAVVGLTESLRTELRQTAIDLSVVMPAVVRTDLALGLPETRVKQLEPQDVAAAIVEALQTGRFDVFVPRSVGRLHRVMGLMPRPAVDALGRALKADKVLWDAAGSGARRGYEQQATTANEPEPAARG